MTAPTPTPTPAPAPARCPDCHREQCARNASIEMRSPPDEVDERDCYRTAYQRASERERRLVEAVKLVADDMREAVGRRRDDLSRKGGQHVPNHGPLCMAPPSVLKDVDWWLARLDALLADTDVVAP